MFLVAWVVLGLVAGGILSWIVYRGDHAHAADMILGAFGALIGGFVFNLAAMREPMQFVVWSLIAAVAGAFLMLAGFHGLRHTGHG